MCLCKLSALKDICTVFSFWPEDRGKMTQERLEKEPPPNGGGLYELRKAELEMWSPGLRLIPRTYEYVDLICPWICYLMWQKELGRFNSVITG